MNIRRTRLRSLVACAAGVACLALTATACSSSGGSSSSSSSSPSAPPATSAPATTSAPAATSAPAGSSSLTGTAKTIATNWVAFFNPATPTATKVTLLQNGSTFAPVLQAESADPTAKTTSAKVDAVTVSGSQATVTWDLLLSGTPTLTNQQGQAVLDG